MFTRGWINYLTRLQIKTITVSAFSQTQLVNGSDYCYCGVSMLLRIDYNASVRDFGLCLWLAAMRNRESVVLVKHVVRAGFYAMHDQTGYDGTDALFQSGVCKVFVPVMLLTNRKRYFCSWMNFF